MAKITESWAEVKVKSGYAIGSVTGTIDLPPNSIVEDVLAQVTQMCATTGTALVTVGDSRNAEGFLKSFDLTSPSGTLFGNDEDEMGEYIYAWTGLDAIRQGEEKRERLDTERKGKFSLVASTMTVTVTLGSVAPTREGVVTVWAKVLRLYPESVVA
jgi:hypothetical protein